MKISLLSKTYFKVFIKSKSFVPPNPFVYTWTWFWGKKKTKISFSIMSVYHRSLRDLSLCCDIRRSVILSQSMIISYHPPPLPPKKCWNADLFFSEHSLHRRKITTIIKTSNCY